MLLLAAWLCQSWAPTEHAQCVFPRRANQISHCWFGCEGGGARPEVFSQ